MVKLKLRIVVDLGTYRSSFNELIEINSKPENLLTEITKKINELIKTTYSTYTVIQVTAYNISAKIEYKVLEFNYSDIRQSPTSQQLL